MLPGEKLVTAILSEHSSWYLGSLEATPRPREMLWQEQDVATGYLMICRDGVH